MVGVTLLEGCGVGSGFLKRAVSKCDLDLHAFRFAPFASTETDGVAMAARVRPQDGLSGLSVGL